MKALHHPTLSPVLRPVAKPARARAVEPHPLHRPRNQALAMSLALWLLMALLLWGASSAARAQAQAQAQAPVLDEALQRQLREWVLATVQPAAPAGARLEVELGSLDSRLRLAPCPQVEPQLLAGQRLWGPSRIGLRCRGGATAWNVNLPLSVKVFAPALVARRALPAGTVLQAEDLQMTATDWAAAATPVFANAAPLGRALARPLASGQALREADLQLRQWFGAGDTVRVVARGDGFSVSAEGQALGAGIDGRGVRVRTDSGRIVTGNAVGARRVELQL